MCARQPVAAVGSSDGVVGAEAVDMCSGDVCKHVVRQFRLRGRDRAAMGWGERLRVSQ